MEVIRREITVRGRVQGVGFRFFTSHCAGKLKLSGWVRNCPDGSVTLEVQGPQHLIEQFRTQVSRGPIFASVNNMAETELPVVNHETGFKIRF